MGHLKRGLSIVSVATLWAASAAHAASPRSSSLDAHLHSPLVVGGLLVAAALLLLVVLRLGRTVRGLRQREREVSDRDRKITRLTSGSHPDPLVGTRFSSWRIIDRLSRSRTSAVYKAVPEATLDEREAVALKIFHAECDGDSPVAERFQRAVDRSRALRHPATTQVEAHGQHAGRRYIVREYINGYPLRNRVRDGGMEIPEFFHLVRQVADALQHAHDQGVTHFDLKPDNIVVYGVLKIKIVDFGLHALDEPDRSIYTAPEVAEGHAVDGRADQYAMGVLIYEMLTGYAPVAEERVGILPPSSRRHELPLAVDSVVLRMLSTAPEARYPTVSAALDALEEALQARAADVPVGKAAENRIAEGEKTY